jgi:hypothetical protein
VFPFAGYSTRNVSRSNRESARKWFGPLIAGRFALAGSSGPICLAGMFFGAVIVRTKGV